MAHQESKGPDTDLCVVILEFRDQLVFEGVLVQLEDPHILVL